MLMDDLITGRAVVLFLALLLWGIFITFYGVINRYQSNVGKRIFFGGACIAASLGLILFQIDAYTAITHIRKPIDNDPYFFWLGVMEWGIPLCVLYVILVRRRMREKGIRGQV